MSIVELTAETSEQESLPDFPGLALQELSVGGLITAVNDAYCALLRRPRSSLIGRSPIDFTHPDDVAITEQRILAGAGDTHTGGQFEKRYLRGDGTVVWVRVTAIWLPDRGRLIGQISDITELVATREAGQRAEARFAGLVDQSTSLIFVLGADGRLTDANPATERLIGRCTGMTIDALLRRSVHPDDMSKLMDVVRHVYRVPGPHDPVTFRVRTPTGGWAHVECVGNNQLADPAISGVIVNGLDVTERVALLRQKDQSLTALIESLGRAAEFRDPYTSGHQHRVAEVATRVAAMIGLDDRLVKGIQLGATIHDIGKVAVPAEILSFPGPVSPAAFEIIKTHCQVGHDIVGGIEFPWPIAQIVLQHHERLDGSGYPGALHADEIIIEAQIVAVADVAEAVTSHRPYRPALGAAAAIEVLAEQRGTRLHADAVDACTELLVSGAFDIGAHRDVWTAEAHLNRLD